MSSSSTQSMIQQAIQIITWAESRNIVRILNFYFSTCVVPIGLLLNICTAIIFSRKNLNRNCYLGYLYSILCILNILALSNSIIITQLLPFYDIDLLIISDLSCKFLSLWRNFLLQCPSWQQAFVSFNLFMNVYFPKRFTFLKKPKILAIIITLMLFTILVINIEYLFFELGFGWGWTSVNPNANSSQTNRTQAANMSFLVFQNRSTNGSIGSRTTIPTSTNSNQFRRRCRAYGALLIIADAINILMRNVVPFFIMLLINIAIISKIRKSKRTINPNTKNNGSRSFIISILAINFLFLLLYLPWSVTFILANLLEGNINEPLISLYQNSTIAISYLNNLSPFLINLAFNKLFRLELYSLVLKRLLGPVRASMRHSTRSNVTTKN
jgi:hypothetical protein